MEPEKKPIQKGAVTLSWSALEFEEKERHPDWLWTVGLVFGLAAAVAFFYGNFFFGILLVVAGIVVILYSFQKPKVLLIEIAEEGLFVSDQKIPFDKIVQFWLDETDKPDKLLLRVKDSFLPMLSIPLGDISTERVRAALAEKKVKEEFLRESRSIALFDRIGF